MYKQKTIVVAADQGEAGRRTACSCEGGPTWLAQSALWVADVLDASFAIWCTGHSRAAHGW